MTIRVSHCPGSRQRARRTPDVERTTTRFPTTFFKKSDGDPEVTGGGEGGEFSGGGGESSMETRQWDPNPTITTKIAHSNKLRAIVT